MNGKSSRRADSAIRSNIATESLRRTMRPPALWSERWIRGPSARVALAPDGRMIVVTNSEGTSLDKQLVGVEMGTGKARWAKPLEYAGGRFMQIAGMRFEGGSSFLNVAMSDGNVIRFNGLTGREHRRFVADGRTAEALAGERRLNRNMRNNNQLMYIAGFSADGQTMVSYGSEWICVWDVVAGTLRHRIRRANPPGCFLALSGDGKTVATVSVLRPGEPSDDEIRLYDTDTGDLVLTLTPGDDRSDVMAFSPDDTKLFTGFYRGTAMVWDVRRGLAAADVKK